MGRVSPKTHPHPHPRGGYEFYTRTRPMTHQTGTHPLPDGAGYLLDPPRLHPYPHTCYLFLS